MDVSYIFIALEINLLYRHVYIGYFIYSRYLIYTFICPLVAQSYTIQGKTVNPLTPRKNTILNGKFVFDLRDIFQERIPGLKRDLLV